MLNKKVLIIKQGDVFCPAGSKPALTICGIRQCFIASTKLTTLTVIQQNNYGVVAFSL